MKFLFILFVVVVGSLLGFMTSLRNGSLIKYLDEHPHPDYVPQIEYSLGHGFALIGEFTTASTYYIRIPQRYPKSDLADTAYYNYLLALDEADAHRDEMAALYETYLVRYPEGKHTEMVKKKIVNCRNRQ